MDKKVQDDVSNSQNDRRFISHIFTQGTAGNCFKLELSDGSFFFVSPEFLLAQKIKKNLFVDEELFVFLQEEDDFFFCKEAALKYVARREHSAFELERKLQAKKFSPEIIAKVTEYLIQRHLLDDRRFALQRVAVRLKTKALGRSALVGDLVAKGIALGLAKKWVYEQVSEEDERVALAQAVEKLRRSSSKTKEKMIQSLIQKGFEFRIIQDYLSKKEWE